LIGHLFNYGLFGMLVVQVYVYSLSFPADSKLIKSFVYGLFVIECLQIVMATHDAYKVFGAGWGDIAELGSKQWLWFDTPVLSGLVSASVQCFFSWRIYLLSRSAYLSIFIGLVAIMQGSGAMAVGIMVNVLVLPNSAIQERTSAPLVVWLGGSVACDVMIATCMLYYLIRGRQGLASDAILSRLIRLTIETGTLTASVACVDLIFFLLFKHNNLHMAPALVLSKLYTNSLMVLFNNRTQLRTLKGGIQASGGRIWVSTVTRTDGDATLESERSNAQEIALRKFPDTDRETSSGRYQASDVLKSSLPGMYLCYESDG
ncbi:hypothetical protein C8Q76DRAFT_627952, partial [Earliella scabrosa]